MINISITGSVGSGKTTVQQLLLTLLTNAGIGSEITYEHHVDTDEIVIPTSLEILEQMRVITDFDNKISCGDVRAKVFLNGEEVEKWSECSVLQGWVRGYKNCAHSSYRRPRTIETRFGVVTVERVGA